MTDLLDTWQCDLRDKITVYKLAGVSVVAWPHHVDTMAATPPPKKRVGMVGIFHETNTFSHIKADYATFDGSSLAQPGGKILRRQEILEAYVGSNHTVAGYHETSINLGYELIPLMMCETGPIGTITKDAYDRLSGEMFSMLRAEGEAQVHPSTPPTTA